MDCSPVRFNFRRPNLISPIFTNIFPQSSKPFPRCQKIVDDDGFIDLNEFKVFHCSGGGVDGNKELKEAFDLYDKDKNGKISATELHSILRSLGENARSRIAKKMIGSVYVDDDGCVNFEEFKKVMNRTS